MSYFDSFKCSLYTYTLYVVWFVINSEIDFIKIRWCLNHIDNIWLCVRSQGYRIFLRCMSSLSRQFLQLFIKLLLCDDWEIMKINLYFTQTGLIFNNEFWYLILSIARTIWYWNVNQNQNKLILSVQITQVWIFLSNEMLFCLFFF